MTLYYTDTKDIIEVGDEVTLNNEQHIQVYIVLGYVSAAHNRVLIRSLTGNPISVHASMIFKIIDVESNEDHSSAIGV